jgi:hypothetical protein
MHCTYRAAPPPCTLLIYQLRMFGSVHRCRGGRKYNNNVAKRVIITRENLFSHLNMAFVRSACTNACHCCTGNMNSGGYTGTATSGLPINPSEDPTKIMV